MTDEPDHAYIAAIETFGSGGQMLDAVMLRDGAVLVITECDVLLYPDQQAFESGEPFTSTRRRA